MTKLDSGYRLGPYEIIELLGEGGMATLYRAQHVTLHREAAIKVIRPELSQSPDFIRRFERESQTIASLTHPNIVSVYDYGRHDELVYLAMELLSGGTLHQLIKQESPLPPAQVERVLIQVAAALNYAHDQGIVHRDLKPQNILFNQRGDAMLTDFGIAKVLSESVALTRPDMLIGTPSHMPPEQWRGELVDARTDIYALGIILFEMLTGQQPYNADTPWNLMHLHIYQPPPSIASLRPDIPMRVDWILNKALAKHRDGRFQAASDLATAFSAVFKQDDWKTEVGISVPEPSVYPEIVPHTPISPSQAAKQEQQALVALNVEKNQLARSKIRLVNALPQDVKEKFKGRLKEQADVRTLLTGGARLVSIYGRGGVGKTALACKVLADLREVTETSTPDGILALSMPINLDRIVTDMSQFCTDDARAKLEALYNGDGASASQKISTLLDALHDGRYILLLDNLETLQDSETGQLNDPDLQTFIETILRQGGPISLLITSRDPLALPRELKPQERIVPLEEGLQFEDAIALLRASDPDGMAGLRDAPDHKLTGIVQRVRGFPRALEAIAGLLLEDSLLDLDALLHPVDKVTILDSEITPLIVEQAIRRLSPAALRVMQILTVFERPAKQAALEYLLAPYMALDKLRNILNRLVRTYYITFNKALQTFNLHPIDRDYCYKSIPNEAEENPSSVPYTRRALNARAAEFYVLQRQPEESWKSLGDLEPQLAEFEHRVRAEDWNTAAQLLTEIDMDYLMSWGHYARVIAMHEQLRGHMSDARLARRSLGNLGIAYWHIGKIATTSECFEQALLIARLDKDQKDEGRYLNNIGIIYREQGLLERAVQSYEQALKIAQQTGDRPSEGNTLVNLGNVHRELGQVELAIDFHNQALNIWREVGNRSRAGLTLSNLGIAHFALGQMQPAMECYEEALAIARETGNRSGETVALYSLGEIYRDMGEAHQALEALQQCIQIAREIGFRRDECVALSVLGSVYMNVGEYPQTIQHLRKALTIADEINFPGEKSRANSLLAMTLLFSGDLSGAEEVIQGALNAEDSEYHYQAVVIHSLILFQLGKGNVQETFERADQQASQLLGKTPRLFRALYARGLVRAGQALQNSTDKIQAAIEDYRAARTICAASGIITQEVRLLDVLIACPEGERLQPIRAALIGEEMS